MLDVTWNNGAVHLNKEHWRYVLGWALGGLHMPNPSLQFLCFQLVLFGSNVLDVISSATHQYSWYLQVLNYLQQYPWEQSFWDYECKRWLLVQWWFLPVPCLGAEALKNKVESVGANKLKKLGSQVLSEYIGPQVIRNIYLPIARNMIAKKMTTCRCTHNNEEGFNL